MFFFFWFFTSILLTFLFVKEGIFLLTLKDSHLFLFYFFSGLIEEIIKIFPLIIWTYLLKIKTDIEEYKLYLGGVLWFIFIESFYYFLNFLKEENFNLSSYFSFFSERIFVALIHLSFFLLFIYLFKKRKYPFYFSLLLVSILHMFYNIFITFLSK